MQQNIGILSAIGIIIFIFTKKFFTEEKDAKRVFSLFTAGFVIPFILFLSFLIFTNSFKQAFYTLVIWPLQGYLAFNRYPYFNCEINTIKRALDFNGGFLRIIYNFSGIATYLFIGFFPPFLFSIFLYSSIKDRDPKIFFLTLCGICLYLSAFTRPDFLHILYTLPLYFLLYFHASERGNRFLSSLLFLIATIVVFERFTAALQVFATPYERVKTARGEVKVPHYYAGILKAVFASIGHATKQDMRIFVYHWSPALYFYSGRENATSYDSYIPKVYNSSEQIKDILNSIIENKTQIIIKDDYIERILASFNPRSLSCTFPYVPRDKLMEDEVDRFVNENYYLAYDFQAVKIYVKK